MPVAGFWPPPPARALASEPSFLCPRDSLAVLLPLRATMLGTCLGKVACPSVCATRARCAERGDGRSAGASPPLRQGREPRRVEDDMSVRVGDRIAAAASTTNTSARDGTIEQVIRRQPLRIAVRWDDGHTSILAPADGSIQIVSAAPAAGATKNRRASAQRRR
jgi:hypothetical protein